MKPARIAILNHELSGGGQARVGARLAGAFARRGHPVDFLFSMSPGPGPDQVPPAVNIVDLRTGPGPRQLVRLACFLALHPATLAAVLWSVLLTPFPVARPYSGPMWVLREIMPFPALARYLRRDRPDVVCSAGDRVNLHALLARRIAGAGTRVVISHHNLASARLRMHAARVGGRRAPRGGTDGPRLPRGRRDRGGVGSGGRRPGPHPPHPAGTHRRHPQSRRRPRTGASPAPARTSMVPPGHPAGDPRRRPAGGRQGLPDADPSLRPRAPAETGAAGDSRRRGAARGAGGAGGGAGRRAGRDDAGLRPQPLRMDVRRRRVRPVVGARSAARSSHRGDGVRLPGGQHRLPRPVRDSPGNGRCPPLPVCDDAALAAAIVAVLDNPPPRQPLVGRAMEFTVERAAEAYARLMFREGPLREA